MVSSDNNKKLANAVGGKTARACDNCIKKRARWYCPSDDAFLCQSCDASVHSANPLARRHERVRLKTSSSIKTASSSSSSKNSLLDDQISSSFPSWHHGFTKKARTPRQGSKNSKLLAAITRRNPLHHLVPEIWSDENSQEENDEQLILYRVPICDENSNEAAGFADHCARDIHHATNRVSICDPFARNSNETGHYGRGIQHATNAFPICDENSNEANIVAGHCACDIYHATNDGLGAESKSINDSNQLQGSLPTELELAEFAADVESLLGKGLDDEYRFDMEGLGLSEEKEFKKQSFFGYGKVVKVEEEMGINNSSNNNNNNNDDDEVILDGGEIDLERETFELNFDYDASPMQCELEEIKAENDNFHKEIMLCSEDCKVDNNYDSHVNNSSGTNKKKILLRLDYEGVIAAWDDQKSPWTTGDRPELDSGDCWPDCLGICGSVHPYGEGIMLGHASIMDGGREARVSRYREKRRTRLFSKKIRYEVRKLNAEKRPRMKGRFVKRTNFSANVFPLQNK
ncbi:hypothetical protein M9H77_08593 [Catharanthus roseus]|uniref:Uncharacterized protein n=1 Tax=Catharanthus roseus TaxID=4058 RepID=A0ACC0BYJ6_CATRO|nr:hypothetical protein M9H77_08593 [Catharanthus roseus]